MPRVGFVITEPVWLAFLEEQPVQRNMDSWTRGGCGLLAEAITRWLPRSARTRRKVVVCARTNTHHVCHVAVIHNGVVIDGYGITPSFERQIAEISAIHENDDTGWFEGDEERPTQTVEPWHPGNVRDFAWYSEPAVAKLVQALRTRFGSRPRFELSGARTRENRNRHGRT